MEWKHASWPQSRQGRCKGCMAKAEKHMWHCPGCNEYKLAPHEFSEWLKGRRSQDRRPGARCNDCTATAKKAREEQRAKSVSMVVKGADPTPKVATAPALTVQIWCRNCRTPKDIDMNIVWRRDGKHRFSNVSCRSCKLMQKSRGLVSTSKCRNDEC